MGKPPIDVRATQPAAPFIAPISGTVDQRLAQLAQAISKKADAGGVPTYGAIVLLDSTGIAWRLTVDTSGQLRTDQVPRATFGT